MISKKQFTLLFLVFLFAVAIYQPRHVDALPFDNEYTDVEVLAYDYEEYYIALTAGETISGYFETETDTQGIDFFICDAGNFTQWDLGYSASAYQIETNMHTNGFFFTVPYDDTWYIVLDNTGGTQSVTVDLAVDVDGDNSPTYSSSVYDYTGYGEVLEDEEHYYESFYLYEGSVIDGHFSTFFTTDGLDFFICDESNFNDWENGYSASGYSIETDMHQANIDSFTVPSSDTWYLVWYAADEVDAVTFSYGVSIDTSNAVGGAQIGTGITMIGIGAALLICLIICCVCRSKKKEPEPRPPTVDHYVAPPSQPPSTTVKEREIVRDRVLVICPYCGAKNEQGVLNCYNCDAEL